MFYKCDPVQSYDASQSYVTVTKGYVTLLLMFCKFFEFISIFECCVNVMKAYCHFIVLTP